MRLRPILRPIISSPLHGIFGPTLAPEGAILHYDADIDAFSELTGGPHTFNHAVLSPQYQRNADGSYTDVGAKPAVDVFGGQKWLRSCGAVTNLLPSGSDNFTGWGIGISSAVTADYADSPYSGEKADRVVIPVGSGSYINKAVSLTGGATYNFSFWAESLAASNISIGLGISSSAAATVTVTSNIVIADSWAIYNFILQPATTGTYWVVFDNNNNTTSCDMLVWHPQLTATAYPVPYVPPGVTQPASNATTTNGMWFRLPDGSPLWKALTGEPLTLATRVRMGVGSGDMPNGTYQHFASAVPTNTTIVQHSYIFSNGIQGIVRSTDGSGTPPPELYLPWPSNSIIRRVTQVNAAGTQYRVGYMIEGKHTTIQWSEWKAYDGSFGPSTLYRLMLGYANAYPMWFNKITAWKEQVDDARILEAMA